MEQSFDSTLHNKDINAFLSSYFTDLCRTISGVRDLVLTLINVRIPSLPDLEVGKDMLSIVTACHKTFNDLKKVESLLRGHVQAKSVANTQKSRQKSFSPIYQQFRNRNSSYSWSQGPHTPFFSSRSAKKSSDVTMTKQLSATTYMSRYTTQQNKSARDQNQGHKVKRMIKNDNIMQLDASFRKMKNIDCQKQAKSSQNQRSSSVKSVEIVKKIQELRQIGTSQIINFENKNQKCLGIIRQMKEEFKLKSSKLKRKTNNK